MCIRLHACVTVHSCANVCRLLCVQTQWCTSVFPLCSVPPRLEFSHSTHGSSWKLHGREKQPEQRYTLERVQRLMALTQNLVMTSPPIIQQRSPEVYLLPDIAYFSFLSHHRLIQNMHNNTPDPTTCIHAWRPHTLASLVWRWTAPFTVTMFTSIICVWRLSLHC